MRRLLSCLVLLLAGLLVAAGIYHALLPDAPLPAGNSGASLGLVLLEKESGAGLYVLAVTQDSPADRADIHPGDTLLQVEKEAVATVEQLDALLDPARQSIQMLVRRDGKEMLVRLPTR